MDAMTAPSVNPSIRIGNDERAAAMNALDEHMSAGRLDPDEYGERVARVSVARTREDLQPLFADLPAPHPFPVSPPPRKGPVAAADRMVERYAGNSKLARVALLVLVGMVALAVLPFLAAGAVCMFIVLPLISCGWRGGPGGVWHRRGWRW